MDKQETFDTVVAHARKQQRKALDADGDCMYRGCNGTKCFVGALMPDALYRPYFEHQGLGDESIRKVMIGKLGHDLALLEELQEVHDCFEVGKWELELQAVANKHLLRYKE